jgi:hypothetical protein
MVMIREDSRTRSILLSIFTVVPLDRPMQGHPVAFRTEITEVQGEAELDA